MTATSDTSGITSNNRVKETPADPIKMDTLQSLEKEESHPSPFMVSKKQESSATSNPAQDVSTNTLESSEKVVSNHSPSIIRQEQKLPASGSTAVVIPVDPIKKEIWRQRVHNKFRVKRAILDCTDHDLFVLHALPFTTIDGVSGAMNPEWLLMAMKLCQLSMVDVCRKFYKHYISPDKRAYSAKDGHHCVLSWKLDAAILLVDMEKSFKARSVSERYCGFCDRHFSHLPKHCPVYPTYTDRINSCLRSGRCTGCLSLDCNLGRIDHNNKAVFCYKCRSYDHTVPVCDNPCVWNKWREEISSYNVVVIATKHWNKETFDQYQIDTCSF